MALCKCFTYLMKNSANAQGPRDTLSLAVLSTAAQLYEKNVWKGLQ